MDAYVTLVHLLCINMGSPTSREAHGDGAAIVLRGRESRLHGEVRQVILITKKGKVREMRTADTVLGIIRERGKKGLPLERVYRLLYHRDLYLLAYGKIYRNAGAMTPGSTPETADEMSLKKIDVIIEAVRYERYQWTPTRRVYIEKKNSTKKRPLSMPTWSDKLLQEVLRLILESYYEPQFSDSSHGFRPGRGCHTALREIDTTWLGTTWFLEGDIKACFDSFDHQILLDILAENIHDERFLRLIRNLLQAGYLEDWKYHTTYSGAPQGGIISPVLSNIYLSRFDRYVEETLRPAYIQGTKRRDNPAYRSRLDKAKRLKGRGKLEEAAQLRQQARQLPAGDPLDPGYQRLWYARYADDWLIGFIGPRTEVVEVKSKIKRFLQEKLKLELSEEKTVITHARTHPARFLGYHISTMQENTYRPKGKRYINGKIGLSVPPDILQKKCQRYQRNGKPIHRPELTAETEYSILAKYQSEYRGLVEYYQLANNLHRLNRLKWIMQQSLTKTLASKLKISVTQVYDKFRTTLIVENQAYKGLQVQVPREGKKPLIATWGGIPLKRKPYAQLNDVMPKQRVGRSELEKRLLADTCEICGSREMINVHHIRALKDLNQKGRADKPQWVKTMAARRRKTLVVCRKCHMDIHAGRPLRNSH